MLRRRNTKRSMCPRWNLKGVSALQVVLTPMITYGKGRTK
jgi:hypothetical protein